MKKEARKAQERTETMHALREIDHVAVSVQGLQIYETEDEEQCDAERQKERIKRLSKRRGRKILENSAARLASVRNTHDVNHMQKKKLTNHVYALFLSVEGIVLPRHIHPENNALGKPLRIVSSYSWSNAMSRFLLLS